MKQKHLVFYDGQCGLCDRVVQIILKADKKKQFLFAPLQGETAGKELQQIPHVINKTDSVILIENYRSNGKRALYLYGKASFRIMWLLGGSWKLLGWGFFFPSFFYDWGYWIVAKNRRRLFPQEACIIPTSAEKERFLP